MLCEASRQTLKQGLEQVEQELREVEAKLVINRREHANLSDRYTKLKSLQSQFQADLGVKR